MIEFRGEISGHCKQYLLRRESKIGLIAGTITAALFSIPLIILTFMYDWIFIIPVPALIIMAVLAGLPPNKKSYDLIIPSSIVINPQDGTLISQSKKFYHTESIHDIKRIIDYGEWYHIFFYDKNGRFVCQKNLICCGTVEEFERLFNGKIVKTFDRKVKTTS